MSHYRYTDDQGNVILTVAVSAPGLMIVPTGKTPADAEHITPQEFEDFKEKQRIEYEQNPYIDPRDKQIQDLTNQLKDIQAKVDKLTPKP